MREYLVSFRENKRMPYKKAVLAMNNEADIQHNKLLKLDNTMLMYRIYNADTLEKLINTVHEIHNVTSSHEKLFAGEHNSAIFRLLYMDALGIQQYAFNSLLFLRVVQDKYILLSSSSGFVCSQQVECYGSPLLSVLSISYTFFIA